MRRARAAFAEHRVENITVAPTERHLIVYADWRHARDQPTVLIYGHYDVQPVDPLSEWRSPPFDPMVRGDNLFGRGASGRQRPALYASSKRWNLVCAALAVAGERRLPLRRRRRNWQH